MYSGRYSSLLPLNTIPVPRVGITSFSVQMATSGIGNQFYHHGLQITLSIATYIISSSMSLFGASVQRTNLEIMSLQTSITPSGSTTCIERSAMPTPRQVMLNSCRAIFTEDPTCFDRFPVSWPTSLSPTSFIQCRSVCLTTSRTGSFTTWRLTNHSASTMHFGHLCLPTMTLCTKTSHRKKFLNGMGRR